MVRVPYGARPFIRAAEYAELAAIWFRNEQLMVMVEAAIG
jgi:hypothetical protein